MKNIKMLADSLLIDNAIERLAGERKISLDEAKNEMSRMSFREYHELVEAATSITPPSGQTIGPTTQPQQNTQPQTQQAPSNVKSVWPGKGAPVEVGMTVGLKGPNGLPVPGQVSQVDMAAKGVKVKNPTTGQDEWMNTDTLEPFMANASQPSNTTSNTTPNNAGTMAEDADLARMKQLAGISENCSGGATGAGAIAIAPAAMGSMKKRQATDEELKKEYTPKEAPKTVVGDTKPNQASGELSANLAVRGKKTASRINNGFKR